MQDRQPSSEDIRKILRQIRDAPADASPASSSSPHHVRLSSASLNWLNTPLSVRLTVQRWVMVALVILIVCIFLFGMAFGRSLSVSGNQSQVNSPNTNNSNPPNSPQNIVTPVPTYTPIPTDTPTSTPTPQVNLLASGQTYDGTFTQDKRQISFGNQLIGGTWDTTFSISDMSGNTFDGTLNLHTLGELGVKGMMIQDVNSVNGSYDQQRFKALIDKYGNDGIFIQFTATRLISGDNLIMNCTYYALVGSDGTIQGLWFYPVDSKWSCAGGVFCNSSDNNIPGGNFTFQKTS